jgi:hypothetical protein
MFFDGKQVAISNINSDNYQIDFNTKNYTIVNGKYSPLLFEYSDTTDYIKVRIAIDSLPNEYTFSLYDIGVSLNRNYKYSKLSLGFYNSIYTTEYSVPFPMYYITKDVYDITTASLSLVDLLMVSKFN